MKAILVIDVPNELEGCTVIADCKLHRVYDKEGNYYLEKKEFGKDSGAVYRNFTSLLIANHVSQNNSHFPQKTPGRLSAVARC